MDRTVGHHKHVIELFEHLYSRVDTDSARELFETTKDVEEDEIKRMIQTVSRFSDR